MNQRWLFRRSIFRPPAEPINTARYEVAALEMDAEPKAFVLEHHYSGSYPAARERFGLFSAGKLVGVAVFSQPCHVGVIGNVFPALEVAAGVELGRFVLLDSVPGNGETWFLARCFELLRRKSFAGVVSFSDPVQRRSADGRLVFPGHVGTIYQAHNAVYLGKGTPRTLRILPDGSVLSARAISKLQAGVKGWEYTAAILERHGADRPGSDLRAWAAAWLPVLTTPLRHHGNHKYAWALDRRLRKSLTRSLPYPKLEIAA